MSRTTYDLDMGSLGINKVEVIGDERAEVLEVWWQCFLPNGNNQIVNIVGEVKGPTLIAMRSALRSSIINERMRGLESAY